MKATTALCGPFDDVVIPKDSVKTDWEVELAVVISSRASYVDEANAMDMLLDIVYIMMLAKGNFNWKKAAPGIKEKVVIRLHPLAHGW